MNLLHYHLLASAAFPLTDERSRMGGGARGGGEIVGRMHLPSTLAEHRGFMGYRSSRAVTPGDGDGGMRRTLIGNTCWRARRPPSAERGGYRVGIGGQNDCARTHMHTHTHTKGFVKTRLRKRGRCRTCHLFSASAGSPFKYPGHSVTGEEGWRVGRRGGEGLCRRDSAIRKQSGDDEVWTHVPPDIKNSRSFFLGRDLGRPPSSANHRVSAIYTPGRKKRAVIHHFPRWHV